MSISIKLSGNFNKSRKFMKKMLEDDLFKNLDAFGRRGCDALNSATPVDTGLTAGSWDYEVRKLDGGCTITWTNNSMTKTNIPIVILLQYGHGTGTGGYVAGQDFINPALRPIFDQIADDVWKAVTSA